jgi:hypothetical protein
VTADRAKSSGFRRCRVPDPDGARSEISGLGPGLKFPGQFTKNQTWPQLRKNQTWPQSVAPVRKFQT